MTTGFSSHIKGKPLLNGSCNLFFLMWSLTHPPTLFQSRIRTPYFFTFHRNTLFPFFFTIWRGFGKKKRFTVHRVDMPHCQHKIAQWVYNTHVFLTLWPTQAAKWLITVVLVFITTGGAYQNQMVPIWIRAMRETTELLCYDVRYTVTQQTAHSYTAWTTNGVCRINHQCLVHSIKPSLEVQEWFHIKKLQKLV